VDLWPVLVILQTTASAPELSLVMPMENVPLATFQLAPLALPKPEPEELAPLVLLVKPPASKIPLFCL
jgi:hypothetical protein